MGVGEEEGDADADAAVAGGEGGGEGGHDEGEGVVLEKGIDENEDGVGGEATDEEEGQNDFERSLHEPCSNHTG